MATIILAITWFATRNAHIDDDIANLAYFFLHRNLSSKPR